MTSLYTGRLVLLDRRHVHMSPLQLLYTTAAPAATSGHHYSATAEPSSQAPVDASPESLRDRNNNNDDNHSSATVGRTRTYVMRLYSAAPEIHHP